MRRYTTFLSAVFLCSLLTACAGKVPLEDEVAIQTPPETSGAKAGAFSTLLLNIPTRNVGGVRPSHTLGIYTSMYLAHGAFLPVQTAMLGITAQQHMWLGQTQPETSETFALLREFGSILQVDIVDSLNRSRNREETLERYTRSLVNIMELAERKMNELTTLQEDLRSQRKEQKKAVDELERAIQKAIKEEDYEFASSKQEELVTLKAELTRIETKAEQTDDILKPYEKLMQIAEKRQNAIDKNRRILIAGLKVIEVPGIENLDILEQERAWQR
ncbi:MAG: hypothetical protein PHO92_02040 [Candidatus Peribacteraceae bacterium]|nr:hypothetical protein [Candidatus Peribacteraceae bacterium]